MSKIVIFIILLLLSNVCYSEISYTIIHENNKLKIIGQFPNKIRGNEILYIPNHIWGTNAGEQIQKVDVRNNGENTVVEYELVNAKTYEANTHQSFVDKD